MEKEHDENSVFIMEFLKELNSESVRKDAIEFCKEFPESHRQELVESKQ
jgi:hypothetical protein